LQPGKRKKGRRKGREAIYASSGLPPTAAATLLRKKGEKEEKEGKKEAAEDCPRQASARRGCCRLTQERVGEGGKKRGEKEERKRKRGLLRADRIASFHCARAAVGVKEMEKGGEKERENR